MYTGKPSFYPYTVGETTNTDMAGDMETVLSKSFTVTKGSTETEYIFGTEMRASFIMPGMKNTNVKGSSCADMIPQGLEYYGGYYFITAYCSKHNHSSVIYVINASTLKYVTTLILAESTHAGGIACANGYLWICGSDGIMYYYKYSDVSAAIKYSEQYPNVKSLSLAPADRGTMYLDNQKNSSFVAAYNGYICVGEHSDDGNGTIQFYQPTPVSGGMLSSILSIVIPEQAQGAEFYEMEGHLYMLITASPSRTKNSSVYVYRSDSTKLNNTFAHKKTISMPCMIEEAVTNGMYTYFVFESCGNKYRNNTDGRGRATDIVGKVCGFSNQFIYK